MAEGGCAHKLARRSPAAAAVAAWAGGQAAVVLLLPHCRSLPLSFPGLDCRACVHKTLSPQPMCVWGGEGGGGLLAVLYCTGMLLGCV